MELVRIGPELRHGNPRRRDFQMRASAESGRVKGYASVWGSLNSYGEIFVPGAFTESLAAKSAEKPLVMCFQHCDVIGKWDVPPSREDDTGLYVEGGISKTSTGADVEILVNDGAITGLSIGFWPEVYAFAEPGETVTFDTPLGRWSSTSADWCIYMLKADVVETSIVAAPADDDARLRMRDVAELLGKAERALPGLIDEASWEDVAYSAARLLGGRGAGDFRDLPDLEHRKLFARIEAAYARHGKTPPAYARGVEYAGIEFRHDEREVFSDRYLRKSLDSVVAGVAGIAGPLSGETRATAESAVTALTEALNRHSVDPELVELSARLRELATSLRQAT